MKSAQVFIFVAMLFSDAQPFGVNMGPFDIVINQVTNCAPKGEDLLNLVTRTYFVKVKGKKTQLFGADFSVPFSREELDSLVVHNEFFQRKNNDYLLMYKYDGGACKSGEDYAKDVVNAVKEQVGLKTSDVCDIPPGNYTFDNWKPVTKFPNPVLKYGSYRAVCQMWLGAKLVGCIEGLGDVKPKST